MIATATERVEEGAKWLDRAAPGWETKIDVGKLVMSSCIRCVIGQVFGHFEAVEFNQDQASDLGFDVDDTFTTEQGYIIYQDLGEAWTQLVKDRLDAGVRL